MDELGEQHSDEEGEACLPNSEEAPKVHSIDLKAAIKARGRITELLRKFQIAVDDAGRGVVITADDVSDDPSGELNTPYMRMLSIEQKLKSAIAPMQDLRGEFVSLKGQFFTVMLENGLRELSVLDPSAEDYETIYLHTSDCLMQLRRINPQAAVPFEEAFSLCKKPHFYT